MSKWTNELIIEAICTFHTLEGRIPNAKDFRCNSKYPGKTTVQRYFVTWNNAIEAAGLTKTSFSQLSKSVIVEKIQHYYNTYNKVPAAIDFINNPEYPSASSVQRHFNNWNNAIIAAGLPVSIYSKFDDISKEKIIWYIQGFYNTYQLVPTVKDFINNPNYPSASTVIKYFNTWNNAIEAAGFTINNGYGIFTISLDGHTYRSRAEAYFCNTFLYNKHEYIIEPKYPKPYNYIYDWYLSDLDVYIELVGGLSPNRIYDKIKINNILNKHCLFIEIKDIYKKTFSLNALINKGRPTKHNCVLLKSAIEETNDTLT